MLDKSALLGMVEEMLAELVGRYPNMSFSVKWELSSMDGWKTYSDTEVSA